MNTGSPVVGGSYIRRIVTRPAIVEATRALGFTDAELSRLMGVGGPSMSAFVRGERPLPKFRHAALIRFVEVVGKGIGSPPTLPSRRHAERARGMRNALDFWLGLARRELGTPDPDVTAKGEALAARMLDQLLKEQREREREEELI